MHRAEKIPSYLISSKARFGHGRERETKEALAGKFLALRNLLLGKNLKILVFAGLLNPQWPALDAGIGLNNFPVRDIKGENENWENMILYCSPACSVFDVQQTKTLIRNILGFSPVQPMSSWVLVLCRLANFSKEKPLPFESTVLTDLLACGNLNDSWTLSQIDIVNLRYVPSCRLLKMLQYVSAKLCLQIFY